MPGDDLSTIDWKVFARSDRYYVKKYEEETNLECHLLLDVSASMGYASETSVSKLEYGSYLAAALAYLMHRQRDSVAFMAFDDRIVRMLPPSARPGHLRSVPPDAGTASRSASGPTVRSRFISWLKRSRSEGW